MKRLLLILILTLSFQSLVKADDISEFEVEGISIGDSALDYFSKETLNKTKRDWFNNNEYSISVGLETSSLKTFDNMQFVYLTKDSIYKLEGIEAIKFYKDNINDCYKLFDQTFLEVKELFSDVSFTEKMKTKHPGDKVGTTMVTQQYIIFKNGDAVQLFCEDWSIESGYTDALRISIRTNKYRDFLSFKAYN